MDVKEKCSNLNVHLVGIVKWKADGFRKWSGQYYEINLTSITCCENLLTISSHWIYAFSLKTLQTIKVVKIKAIRKTASHITVRGSSIAQQTDKYHKAACRLPKLVSFFSYMNQYEWAHFFYNFIRLIVILVLFEHMINQWSSLTGTCLGSSKSYEKRNEVNQRQSKHRS